jgi:hypothetical protein
MSQYVQYREGCTDVRICIVQCPIDVRICMYCRVEGCIDEDGSEGAYQSRKGGEGLVKHSLFL